MRTERDAILSLQRHVAATLPGFTEILTEVENEAPARPFAVVSADGDWTATEHVDQPWLTLPATIHAYVQGATRKAAREAAEDAREALWLALRVGLGDGHERLVPLYDYTGRPEVQRVAVAGATSGTFTLALDGAVAPPLDRMAQPRDVRLALEQLAAVDPGDVWVYGRRGGPWDVRFDGRLRGQNIAPMVGDASALVGAAPAVTVEVLSEGSPDPWRDPRDFLRVEAPTFGGQRDPADPRLRTVTVGVRLTWGRGGRVRSPEMTLRTITARPI